MSVRRVFVLLGCVLLLAVGGSSAAAAPVYDSGGAYSTCPDSSCNAYFSADVKGGGPDHAAGFSWYSQAWPLLERPIDGLQIGLSSTWISPDNVDQPDAIQKAFCSKSKYQDFRRDSWWGYFQTIEGSLGWWGSTRFRTVMPKYAANGTPDCYTTMFSSPGWTFDDARAVKRNEAALVQLSNRLLMPPDGMPLTPRSNGTYLGSAWMSLPLPNVGQSVGGVATGTQAWTLFLKARNFDGPVAYWLPQAWSAIGSSIPSIVGLGLDTNSGHVDNFSSEWNTVPVYTATDSAGTVFSKVPRTQFPIDAQGRTIFTRDPAAYSASAISDPLARWIAGSGALPRSFAAAATKPLTLTTSDSTFYQQQKALPDLLSTVSLSTFEGGAAYGFAWPKQRGTGYLPETFREQGNTRVAVEAGQTPVDLQRATFPSTPDPIFTYRSPGWWRASRAASSLRTTRLLDGSMVTYRWYRFVDQPALQRLNLTSAEADRLQQVVTRMQRGWARGAHFMARPAQGGLSTLDPGLIVKPPRGLEYGYVPYVVQQSNAF
jgi:hypothetical protein